LPFFYVFAAKVNRLCELNVRKLKKLKDSGEKSLMSTSSRMFFKIAEVGLRGFDMPFETVDVEMPICSESHLLVRFFSTKTNLTRVYLPYYMYFYCANIPFLQRL